MSWTRRLLERDVLMMAGVGIVLGLLAGFGGFYVASSRGLDSLGGGDVIGIVAAIAAGSLFLIGLTRLVWFDDPRLVVLVMVLVAGAWAGDRTAFTTLPGNTTDGTLVLRPGSLPPAGAPAKCTWDRQRGLVTAVESRRNLLLVAFIAATARLDYGDSTTSRLTVTALDPLTFEPVSQLVADLTGRPGDDTGRMGEVTATEMRVEHLPDQALDPAFVDYVNGELDRIGRGPVELIWECPRLP